jgi:hypothetical protein
MKSKKLLLSISLLLGAFTYLTLSSSSGGVMGKSTSGCTGSGCHNNDAATTVTLTGIPAEGFTPGAMYAMTLSVNNPSKVEAGFDMTVNQGNMSGAPAGTMLMGGIELHHTTPKAMMSGVASWNFNWQAPASSSSATFSISANAVNGDNNSTGDAALTTTITFNQAIASGVEDVNAKDIRIFPNPASDFMMLHSDEILADATIKAITLQGSVFDLEVTPKSDHEYRINTENLPSGHYILYFRTNGKQQTRLFQKN